MQLQRALAAFLDQWQTFPCTRVLDVGCGEGYFLSALTQELELKGWGVDLSAYAIEAAARAHPNCAWIVANADRRLPFLPGSFQLLLSIASRKNGEEFHRILAEQGRLLVVVPAPEDLWELREALLGQAIDKDRAATATEALAEWFVLERESLTRSTHQLDASALEDLLKGSYRGARRSEQQRFSQIRGLEVTLSYRLLGYRRKNQ